METVQAVQSVQAVPVVDDECPICLEKKSLIGLGCGHTFCEDCIIKWLPNLTFKNGSCPVCRKRVELGDCTVWGRDVCNHTQSFGFDSKSYWMNHPAELQIEPNDVFRSVKRAMPTKAQFKLRYENKATNHILIEVKWVQLDPFIRRSTRSKKTRVEKRVLLSVWVVPREGSFEHRVCITTAPLEDDTSTVIFEEVVEDAFGVILKNLLKPFGPALYVKENICLRPIHSGMRLSLYDGKGFIHTEVLRILVA